MGGPGQSDGEQDAYSGTVPGVGGQSLSTARRVSREVRVSELKAGGGRQYRGNAASGAGVQTGRKEAAAPLACWERCWSSGGSGGLCEEAARDWSPVGK